MDRIILHSDMNNFYASVECMLHPELRDKYVAVCGNREDRHGIVLAKNQKAKLMGVKTGEAIWEAVQKCPNLVIVPPHFEEYAKYSRLAHKIYAEYTDLIEPFGPDECWLDVTGSVRLFGSGYDIAYKIKEEIKSKLSLTVSVGVSFNKIFAKLGSDMKKPDAITCINKEDFKEKIWGLPASELLYVGRATTRKLFNMNIKTIGDLANTEPRILKSKFGKNGLMLWTFANGLDTSRVAPLGYAPPPKSIGHGITCVCDLKNSDEVWKVIFELTGDIIHRMYMHKVFAGGVALAIRDNNLETKEFQCRFDVGVLRSQYEIAREAFGLYNKYYVKTGNVRAISVRAIHLISDIFPRQIDLFTDVKKAYKKESLEDTLESIRNRFGRKSVTYAQLLGDLKMPKNENKDTKMPSMMYK